MPRKAKERLDGWDRSLWEMRAFLFSTVDEFDDWCREIRAKDVTLGVSRAAKFFHLDARKASHRKLLFFILADVLFGDPHRVGRRKGSKKWTNERLHQLLSDHAEVTNSHGRMSDKEAADKIKDSFQRYRHIQARELRRRLPEARQMKTDFGKRLPGVRGMRAHYWKRSVQ